MRSAYHLLVCLFLMTVPISTNAVAGDLLPKPENEAGNFIQFSECCPNSYTPDLNFGLQTSRSLVGMSTTYGIDTVFSLLQQVIGRLGIRYRYTGIDNRGYDCSGFVWRVFHEAGIEFKRSPARTLWATLPEATEKERLQFGTLVFFNRLKHVGIVRDAYSFYHASRSRGVVRSNFSAYWKKRIVGYRRALVPIGTQGEWRGDVKSMQDVIQRSAELWQTIAIENEQSSRKRKEDVKSMQDVIHRSAKLWQTVVADILPPQRSRKFTAEGKP